MEENQDARQKEKAKEIKVRIKFFNTKKSGLHHNYLGPAPTALALAKMTLGGVMGSKAGLSRGGEESGMP